MRLSTRETSPRRCTQSGRANVFFLGKLTTLKNDARAFPAAGIRESPRGLDGSSHMHLNAWAGVSYRWLSGSGSRGVAVGGGGMC